MPSKYRVVLSEAERKHLLEIVRKGAAPAQRQTHAHILLLANRSKRGLSRTDAQIHEALGVATSTIERTRQRFVEAGLEAALDRSPTRRRYERVLDGAGEARLIALACSTPPDGCARWTLRLLADQLVVLEVCEGISHETVRRTLKKTS